MFAFNPRHFQLFTLLFIVANLRGLEAVGESLFAETDKRNCWLASNAIDPFVWPLQFVEVKTNKLWTNEKAEAITALFIDTGAIAIAEQSLFKLLICGRWLFNVDSFWKLNSAASPEKPQHNKKRKMCSKSCSLFAAAAIALDGTRKSRTQAPNDILEQCVKLL